jgi:EAL domain-containing protein (putative c-di-GMP-specific phosphodiesterase class I)
MTIHPHRHPHRHLASTAVAAAAGREPRLRALPATGPGRSTSSNGLPGRFELRYQPTYALETGEVVGCEALLRWNHPTFGLLRPHAALAGTRWADLLADVDAWVVGEACRQRAAWRAEGLAFPVAVNASPERLRSGALVEDLRRAMDGLELEEGDVSVDLDAFAAIDDPERDAALDALGDLGIGVALQAGVPAVVLPDVIHHAVTSIKVHVHLAARSDGRTPHASVVAVTRAARRSHLTVVAANLETTAQAHAARSVGIEIGFGHLLAPAVGAAHLGQLAREAMPTRRSA